MATTAAPFGRVYIPSSWGSRGRGSGQVQHWMHLQMMPTQTSEHSPLLLHWFLGLSGFCRRLSLHLLALESVYGWLSMCICAVVLSSSLVFCFCFESTGTLTRKIKCTLWWRRVVLASQKKRSNRSLRDWQWLKYAASKVSKGPVSKC
jgi:hypothetical protein